MTQLTEELLQRMARPTIHIVNRLKAQAPEPLRPVFVEIRDHFHEEGYTVEDLRRTVGSSKRIFSRFRRQTGLTPWKLVRECRMEMATRLLRDTKLCVSDVAYLVGYGDFHPFLYLCRQWCGRSPARLRIHLLRVRSELCELPEEAISWTFWQRCREGRLSHFEADRLIDYFEHLYRRA